MKSVDPGDTRLRTIRMVLAVLDDDEDAWLEALNCDDHTSMFWVMAGLIVSIGKDGYGSEEALRYRLRQLEGACATTLEFGPSDDQAP